LIDSESAHAEILRRAGEHWITLLVRGRDALLRLESVDLPIPTAELYDGIELDDEEMAERSNP
jgi:hypothetical protein